eukprot:11823330-Ditylum_brightwellii.AAC.1
MHSNTKDSNDDDDGDDSSNKLQNLFDQSLQLIKRKVQVVNENNGKEYYFPPMKVFIQAAKR